jgi:hypothetical protein
VLGEFAVRRFHLDLDETAVNAALEKNPSSVSEGVAWTAR